MRWKSMTLVVFSKANDTGGGGVVEVSQEDREQANRAAALQAACWNAALPICFHPNLVKFRSQPIFTNESVGVW